LNLHATFSSLDDANNFTIAAEIMEKFLSGEISDLDVVIVLWFDILSQLGLVEVVEFVVDLVSGLRHLVSEVLAVCMGRMRICEMFVACFGVAELMGVERRCLLEL
jgi:hypothetical protein